MAVRNLVNLEDVHKSFGRRPLLDGVSLGIGVGERVGVVGRNGGGKSTLLQVMAGIEPADLGRVTRASGLRLGLLSQSADIDPRHTVREHVLADSPNQDWVRQAATRDVLEHLLGGFDDAVLDRELGQLSGGERRRAELARLLISDLDLLLLDEPTNHLDLEAVFWLAQYLNAQRDLAVVVVTHDRWFLDEVGLRMWEVVDGSVQEYDGGYSAFVLAKAERARQASASEQRRNALIRKELAWLRRGPPARTSKPKFRIDAANELISAEPAPRDQVELLAFAGARLGKTVFEMHDVSLAFGERRLFDHADWNVGPGDRIGIVGVNGAGKTTLLRLLLGQLQPDSGKMVKGLTVKPAYLSQHMEELDPQLRVLAAVQEVANRVEIGKGRELTASQLCERLGFGTDGQWTPVGDLSGGERRRLQLTRLLMSGPNVLVLDEPTNDFDVETLAALEDLLDSFAGTILIVSHDRYFIERVCDSCVGLLGNGSIRHLPAGIEQYLALRAATVATEPAREQGTAGDSSSESPSRSKQQRIDDRARAKELARLERLIERAEQQERVLHERLAEHATDHLVVAQIDAELVQVVARRQEAEEAWLLVAEQ